MTDRIDVRALRALLDKATPGPWRLEVDPDGLRGPDTCVKSDGIAGTICCDTTYYPTAVDPDDQALIAAAITALPELLRVYQAVADAPEGEVVESGWDDDDERDGSVYGIASAMIGQRVRLVPSRGGV